jgi:CheY-like chemotaxis protein
VALFEELGRRAAAAVDNARLFVEAQEASRGKDEFLSNVSHELRTPMTAILGWAHLLHATDLDPADVRLGISTIRQSAQSQAKLIDDLLDVSRIISGKLHLNMSPTNVADVAAQAAATFQPAAGAKRQEVTVAIRDVAAVVVGDGARLQQVFWNLLANAVKFTPPGGSISMIVERRDDDVVVRVSDTGEGIAAEYLPRVFDRFRQLSKETHTGLGIGLAIARELVEMHGGTIRAESDGEDRGATFIVTLPAAPSGVQAGATDREREHLRLTGVRVLVVEDDETTRTLMVTMLRSFGAEVFASRSAREALSVVHSFAPEIVVTDIAMPGDDGVSLLHKLRDANVTAPVVAVTGYADSTSRQRVLDAGFEAFVSKPIDPSEFAGVLEHALRAREPGRR